MHQVPEEYHPLLLAELRYRLAHPGYYTGRQRTIDGLCDDVWRLGIGYFERRRFRHVP
jgi:hypothetical protein